MAYKETAQADGFMNIVVTDKEGKSFSLAGKPLFVNTNFNCNCTASKIVRSIWNGANAALEKLQETGEAETTIRFSAGSFIEWLKQYGDIEIRIRNTAVDVEHAVDDDDFEL